MLKILRLLQRGTRRASGKALVGVILGVVGGIAEAVAGEMTFENVCAGNFPDSCYIRAAGEITAATPDAFLHYLLENEPEGSMMLLDGGGGDLEAGLRLGGLIRDAGYETEIGLWAANGNRGAVKPGGICAGACAYAFLGGPVRRVPDGNRLSFPAGGTGARRQEPALAGLIVSYLQEIGVDTRLFALEAGSDGELTLDEAQLAAFSVVTATGFGPFRLEPDAVGIQAVSRRRGAVRVTDRATELSGFCRNGRPLLRLSADTFLPDNYLPDSRLTVIKDGTSREEAFTDAQLRRMSDDAYELKLDTALATDLALADAFEISLLLTMIDGGPLHARFDLTGLDRAALAASFGFCLQ